MRRRKECFSLGSGSGSGVGRDKREWQRMNGHLQLRIVGDWGASLMNAGDLGSALLPGIYAGDIS